MKSVLFHNVEKRSTATGFTKDLNGAHEDGDRCEL